jgi:hypothetical protein
MKKLLVLSIAMLLALPAVSAGAAGGKQEVSGSIILPTPFTDNSTCYAGIHRRLTILTMGNVPNGLVGYEFEVDKATANKNFVLEPTGGTGSVDLDITFYQAFGTAEQVVTDPLNAGAPVSLGFNTRAAGGESGKVPKGYPLAIICLYTGDAGQGANASFTYTAGAGVKAKK